MENRKLSVKAVFDHAVEIDSPDERNAFLDDACGDDDNQRRRVEALLEAYEQSGSFLESPPPGLDPTEHKPISEGPGTVIGNYKLLQEVGEGGMGTVFMAEQLRPVKRRVAVKIIKQGMDTRQVIARFEAERQALAMMDHPNIARVLDAGCTETGRPYFIMELVKGIPITKFCDENRLTARERLELFVSVCQAVQHAHQKGIIHRDLKPSNVLVALYDDRPVPKIIDFGVAKATNQQLTEKTLFTQIGQIVGTWEYMSPEQAVLNQLDVDTRTDIYSLGVILYELLTGVTPLESSRLRSAALEETLRLIREEEPPKPSTRVSSLGESATATAAYRGTNAASLAKTLRGDMDWIVMKALEKDRTRRYETANGLAADLNRYLSGDPIEARPPSTAYRLAKAASRHRATLATTGLVMVALIAGTVTSTWLAVLVNHQKNAAERARDEAQAALATLWEELADRAVDDVFSGDFDEAHEAIRKARIAKAPGDLLQTLEGLAFFFNGRSDEAIVLLEKATSLNPNSLTAWSALWWATHHAAQPEKTAVARQQIVKHCLSPRTRYERLFQAIVDTYSPAKKSDVIERFDGLLAERSDWGVAYAFRAIAWREYGMASKKLDHFQTAVDDFAQADTLIPDSPFVQTIGLSILTSGIEVAEFQGVDSSKWHQQAEKIAARFDEWPEHLLGRGWRATFYYRTGQTQRAEQEEAELIKRGVGSRSAEKILRFQQDRQTLALERELRAYEDESSRICLAHVLAEKSEQGRAEAARIFTELQKRDVPATIQVLALDIPLLLGQPEEARKVARRLLSSEMVAEEWDWWRYMARYTADDLEQGEFSDLAGPIGGHRCVANYRIAMKWLACGQRQKAMRHFQLAADTGKVGWWDYHWSKAFLQRMKEDPEWPDWIPPTTRDP